jgi:hypothetical protein
LEQLLEQVQRDHTPVQVLRDGRAVAEVRPIDAPRRWRLPPLDPALKAIITPEDAMAPLDEEDWPSEFR